MEYEGPDIPNQFMEVYNQDLLMIHDHPMKAYCESLLKVDEC